MRSSQLHALPFVLLLATFKSSLGLEGCNLCLDGSTITKPDYVLGFTEPFVINTCKALSDTLLFIDNDSDSCRASRTLSAICGCPIAENACSICEGSQNITRPQQSLDGLIDFTVSSSASDLEFVDTTDFLQQNDIAVTCALAESKIQSFQNGQPECLEQPFDDLRLYCGCSSEDEEESNECTLCPGGEIVQDQSGIDTLINIGNEDMVTCEDAKTLVAKTEKGTEVCNSIQRVSTQCGCPIPENACRLCKNGGVITDTNKRITTPSGEDVSCESFEAQLHNFESSSFECTSLDDDSYANFCGCSESEAFVPCTLCVGGETVPKPEKVIKGLDVLGLGFLKQTCDAMQGVALLVHEKTPSCKFARTMAQLCDCNPREENTCTICGSGADMTNPFKEVVFVFGPINNIYPEVFQGESRSRLSTCEIAQSAMASLYTQDDSWCYWNQLMRGQFCGCPDNSDIIALVWTQRCSGILSLSGSLLIIISIITKPRNVRWSPYNQIVLGISFFDSLSSAAYIIGTAFTPMELGLHGSIGNQATCGF